MNHMMLEKLDGSMVTPLILQDGKYIRWATKRGIGTDVANEVERFILNKNTYNEFARMCYDTAITPIFEFIAPNNRIVVPYDEGKLVLLAMRENISGKYLPYDVVRMNAQFYNILHVGKYFGELDEVHSQTGIEGAIVLFEDGHMIKAKCDWYVQIHKAKDGLRFEKDILTLILNHQLDDLLPHLMDTDKERIKKYQSSVLKAIIDNKHRCIIYHDKLEDAGIDRKEFALKWADKLNPFQRYLIYKTWDYWKIEQTKIQGDISDYMLNHCSNKTTINKLHNEIEFERWN